VQIVRACTTEGRRAFAAVLTDNGLAPLRAGIHDLLAGPADDLRAAIDSAGPATTVSARLMAPVSGLTEIWAAGVTYERSREARMAESTNEADTYDRVYHATRPELFYKAAAWRVSGTGEPISVRADSLVNVPEPELAVVANSRGEIVGYTICNDVSSRSIEGENPLYLPQAKAYLGACAVGPGITPVWEVPNPLDISMTMSIERAGKLAWHGEANTGQLHRDPADLLSYLFRADEFPHGVVLSTGTSLVPQLPFTLEAGDIVSIHLAGLGTLTNPVVVGKTGVDHLVRALDGEHLPH
jgi:2-dehydro-3-deoxy-D-arabinonate dehydratase